VTTRLALAAIVLLGAGVATIRADHQATLAAQLDAVFDAPALERALTGVRIESLRNGTVIYARDASRHVIPASNMKLVTMAVAAERLGWDFTFETRLEAAGSIEQGTLRGDLVVVGSGDPSIGSSDEGPSPIFTEWIRTLRGAGIRRVDGRLIGDDDAYDDRGLGTGWAWDDITAGYSAPSGALTYNENVVVVRVTPAPTAGQAATVRLTPTGSAFDLVDDVTTTAADDSVSLAISRELGSRRLMVRGRVPANGRTVVRTTSIDNPTRYFVDSLRGALEAGGIPVTGGAWDIDDLEVPPVSARRTLLTRHSLPLTVIGGAFMKPSQNLYGEILLKAIGRAASGRGTARDGRRAVGETLASWEIPEDAVVVADGSGLSRMNYVTADAIVAILKRVWRDERMRGPFLATLPIGGRDGTLASRMKTPELDGRVQAKTGTLTHVRALSGYLTTTSGEKVVFSMIANHFTAPTAEVDAVMEEALTLVASK